MIPYGYIHVVVVVVRKGTIQTRIVICLLYLNQSTAKKRTTIPYGPILGEKTYGNENGD